MQNTATDLNQLPTPETAEDADLGALFADMLFLRQSIAKETAPLVEQLAAGADLPFADEARLANLADYLTLRRRDIRPLQRRLMRLGFSSLGRLESRVLPTLDATLASLAAAAGRPAPFVRPTEETFFRGEADLVTATDDLFGEAPANRRGRIMVTLPSEAAADPDLILDLVRRGMNIARINCAHDDRAAWMAMTAHVRAAGEKLGVPVRVLMDIAGPKIRTEQIMPEKKGKLQVNDLFRLVADGEPALTGGVTACASVSLPEIVTRLSVGDRVRYDDGKLEGVVEARTLTDAIIRVTHCKTGGTKLKPEKGLNLPDTALGLSPLTTKDEADLSTVVECADMLGYSFVSRPEDIDLLEAALAKAAPRDTPLGLVAKIEQPEAVRNLPALIAAAFRHQRPFGVMIARGDLAAEIGFDRVAEMQEEILWICEAASVPTIWATQVLEDLVKTGLPSRGEMTDAAMAARAECVMLNKGPAVSEAVSLLDHLLSRMDGHIFKKTPMLRALKSWQA
ncbi:pyruvate kinase [Rhizobium straminoryzae]|uniref:Pyruvate kinase n=2 Tax=Rhizobium straminoryzae TaxID=1387186 RepID=A0A549SY85_9HYPH|nr:pyruvate kinase [Rhizobium straminoryzae]